MRYLFLFFCYIKSEIPSQIHLSYHDSKTRSISWVTFKKSPQYLFLSERNLGRLKRSLVFQNNEKVFEASTEIFFEPEMKFYGKGLTRPIAPMLRYIHNVTFPVTIGSYSYMVGNEEAVSEKLNFDVFDDQNLNILAIGDLGLENAVTYDLLKTYATLIDINMVMHLGDLCYNLHEQLGMKADKWMNFIQPVAAQTPYQTLPGNHEKYFNYTHYESRYKNVARTANPHYYSFDIGPIHVLFYNNDFYFRDLNTDWGKRRLQNQLNFIKRDLKKANQNRDAVPWIIVAAHHPLYCSNTNHQNACFKPMPFKNGTVDNYPVGVESILMRNKVDMVLAGHTHSYERSFPVYDFDVDRESSKDGNNFFQPKYPIYVTSGSAGNREELAPFSEKQPDWSAYRASVYALSMIKANREKLSLYQINQHGTLIDTLAIHK